MVDLIEGLKSIADHNYVVIAGDLNLPSIDWATQSAGNQSYCSKEGMFLEFRSQLGLSQLVDKPTRQSAIFDIALSNSDDVQRIEIKNPPVPSDLKMVMSEMLAASRPNVDRRVS